MELSNQLRTVDLSMTSDPDIDDLRGQQESEASWQHRRRFLLVHRGNYPIGRLNQLSYCFSNVLMYACEYSDSLMKELSALAVGVAIADSLERGDASVRVSKTFLRDIISNKKNALLAERQYMKKLHELRKNRIPCQSEDLNELKQRGECIFSGRDSTTREINSPERTVAVRDESEKLSPLGQNFDFPFVKQISMLSSLGKRSEFSSPRQNSEISPCRQSLSLTPPEKPSKFSSFGQSSELSPLRKNSESSLLGRLKFATSKDDSRQKFEESPAPQYKKETKKTLLVGTPRLLCSGARRQAEEAKIAQTLRKENNGSSSGKDRSLLSRPEHIYRHDLKSVNFEPRTSCLNRGGNVYRSSSIGLSLDDNETAGCIQSSEDVFTPAEPSRSVRSSVRDDGNNDKEGDFVKSKDHLAGGRVYHSYTKSTTHLSQSSGQDTPGERYHDLCDGSYTKRSLEVTNQGDITPMSRALLSGTLQKGEGHVSKEDRTHVLSPENQVGDQGETSQNKSDEVTTDLRFRRKQMESMSDQPDQDEVDSRKNAEMLTKSEKDKIFQSFVSNSSNTQKDSVPKIGGINKRLELLKICVNNEKESGTVVNPKLGTSEKASGGKSQREKAKVYVNSKRRGEITPMTGKSGQQGRVGVSPVPRKEKTKFPVLDFRKNLIRSQNSSWKNARKAQKKSQQEYKFKSEKLENLKQPRALKANDQVQSWSQNQCVVDGPSCDGQRMDEHQPGTEDSHGMEKDVLPYDKYGHQHFDLTKEPLSKTRREGSVLIESNIQRTSGHYPYSKPQQNSDTSNLMRNVPLENMQKDTSSRSPIETLNDKMFASPQGWSRKTKDSVKSSPTLQSLKEAQQTYRRLQRIKSQTADKDKSGTEADSGKLKNVQIGLSPKLVKSDQGRTSDFFIKAHGKQIITSAVEKDTKWEQELQNVGAQFVNDVKEPLPSYSKSQRKDISLYSEKLARKYSSKSTTEMAGRDYMNVTDVSKIGSIKVGREDPCGGTKTQQKQVMDLSLKSSKMAESSDKYYFSSFEGGGSFLVPNVQYQGQGQKRHHQSAPDSLEVKNSQGHLEMKVPGSVTSVVQGKNNTKLTAEKAKSIESEKVDITQKRKELAAVFDKEVLKRATTKKLGTRDGPISRTYLKGEKLEKFLLKSKSKGGNLEKTVARGQSKSGNLEESTVRKKSKSTSHKVSTAQTKIKDSGVEELAGRKSSSPENLTASCEVDSTYLKRTTVKGKSKTELCLEEPIDVKGPSQVLASKLTLEPLRSS